MKIKLYLLVLAAITFTACERIVDVDLDTAPPRLVIDASIEWEKGTLGKNQTVYLRTTSPYFSDEIPTVSNAIVFITKDDTTFEFTEIESGIYVCNNFEPEFDATYELTVIVDNQTYKATETLRSVPIIDNIQQNNEGGFFGDDIEIKVFYTDNANTNDFYLSKFQPNFTAIPEFDVSEDRFFQGNTIFSRYSSEDLQPGSQLDFKLSGISERYYNYMNILLSIAGSNGGSPFSSPPSTVRGNIVNTTNLSNFALGYFNVSETTSAIYIVE